MAMPVHYLGQRWRGGVRVSSFDARAKMEMKPSQRDAAAIAVSRVKETESQIILRLVSNSGIVPTQVPIIVDEPRRAFWSWTPPCESHKISSIKSLPDFLYVPIKSLSKPLLPPFMSSTSLETIQNLKNNFVGMELEDASDEIMYSFHTNETHHVLSIVGGPNYGYSANGSPWWKETREEEHEDGRVLKYTVVRGTDMDLGEWQNLYWEVRHGSCKEIGSSKCGRDAHGNVSSDSFHVSMRQEYLEKFASKWATNGDGSEWLEEWCEHHHSGKCLVESQKWARFDPSQDVDPDHPNCWMERFSKLFNGRGGCTKLIQKFSTFNDLKWVEEWTQSLDENGLRVEQGKSYLEDGEETWKRNWAEDHDGSRLPYKKLQFFSSISKKLVI